MLTADFLVARFLVPAQQEPVLLGSAMFAAVAAGNCVLTFPQAMHLMFGQGHFGFEPRAGSIKDLSQ